MTRTTATERRNARMHKMFDDAKPGARLDAGWSTGDPLTEQEQTRRGGMLADVLLLRKDRLGRWPSAWGNKTDLGLYRTIKRIIEEGK